MCNECKSNEQIEHDLPIPQEYNSILSQPLLYRKRTHAQIHIILFLEDSSSDKGVQTLKQSKTT